MKSVKIIALIMAFSLLMPLAFGCANEPDLTADETKTSEPTETAGTSDPTDTDMLTLYVSPNGDDTADGSIGAPLATLEGAAAAASNSSASHVEIVMTEGTYRVSSTLYLPTELTNGRTVRIIGDGDVLFSGMVELSPSDFYIPNDEVSARFKDDAREHIVAIDLSGYGVDVSAFASLEPENRVPYMNGEQLTLARYPDANAR